MANSEKFSRIIEYKGIFDASSIIASFKKMSQELKGRGASETDILNLDGEIKKVEQLNKTIIKTIGKGFKTPKEFNEFTKMTTQMSTSLSRLSEEFQNIDASNISNALKSSTTQTKLLEQKTKELIKDYENSVKQVFKEGEARQKILEATRQNINNLKAGKQAENDIAALYKQELALQQEKVKQSEKDFQNEKENLRILKEKKEQLQDIQSFGQQSSAFGNVFLQAGNYQKVSTQNGQEVRTALSNADMQNVYSSISKAFSGKGDLDALSRALKQYNIELVEGAKDAALFTNAAKAFNSALKSNNQSIKDSESKQKELKHTWDEALAAFQKLNIALGEGDKFGQGTLFTNLDLAVNSVNRLADAQQRMTIANENANKPLPGLTQNISLQNQLNSSIEQGIEATRATIKEQKNLDSTFDQLSNRFRYLFSFMSMWHAGMRAVKQTFEDIKGIDKAFASIAMVTDYDISGLWEQYNDYAKIANELGQSTESVIQSSALYYQQGK